MYELARRQLSAYPAIAVKAALAACARIDGDEFALTLSREGGEVRTRSLVLASGMDYEVPDVPGFAELWGGAVFHCPFCHGWEVRDQRVAVYGPADVAPRLATLLTAWTDEVITVDPADVSHARVEAGALCGLVRCDGSEIACDAVLVHAPLRQRGQLAQDLGLN